MVRRFTPGTLVLQLLAYLLLTVLAVKAAETVRVHFSTGFERRAQFVTVQPWLYLAVLGIWAIFFVLFGALDRQRGTSLLADLGNVWVTVSVAMLVLASLFYLLALPTREDPSRLFFLYFYGFDLLLVSIATTVAYRLLAVLRRGGRHVRRVLLVGAGVQGRHVAVRLRGQESAGIRLIGYLSAPAEAPLAGLSRLGDLPDLLPVVEQQQVEEVVMALPATEHYQVLSMNAALQECGVVVRVLPDLFEMVAMRTRVEDFFGLPLISIGEPSMSPVQARLKRTFDLAIAGPLLVLTSPIMLLIAVAIRLNSPGPILIHQRRVGARGKLFPMHKFRTMRWNPAELDAAFEKVPDDPRVTGLGRLLRRSSLDELPQLWNVLVGEMSLVGPRPELPAIVEGYEPWQRKRFGVPPGMTGWWQVNGRAERSMHRATEVDLFYVQNYSILLDIQILLRTLGAVIRGTGAY